MAPCVLQKRGYLASVDWWSLGIVLYEMLFGQVKSKRNSLSKDLYSLIISLSLFFDVLASFSCEIKWCIETSDSERTYTIPYQYAGFNRSYSSCQRAIDKGYVETTWCGWRRLQETQGSTMVQVNQMGSFGKEASGSTIYSGCKSNTQGTNTKIHGTDFYFILFIYFHDLGQARQLWPYTWTGGNSIGKRKRTRKGICLQSSQRQCKLKNFFL